jgi:hypothetical protein
MLYVCTWRRQTHCMLRARCTTWLPRHVSAPIPLSKQPLCFFFFRCCCCCGCAFPLFPAGWEYMGPLCESPPAAMHTMWECPIMAQLSSRPAAAAAAASPSTNGCTNGDLTNGYTNDQLTLHPRGHIISSSSSQAVSRHMLCVSPDYCVNVPLCYLGSYAAGRFELDAAAPPQRLDLGDILYAPNVLTDEQVRAAAVCQLSSVEFPAATTAPAAGLRRVCVLWQERQHASLLCASCVSITAATCACFPACLQRRMLL